MFENPGSKIKDYAKILFWVETIIFVICAFVFGIGEDRHGVGVFLFFSLLIGGPALAYITSLFLCAFGDIAEAASNSISGPKRILHTKHTDNTKLSSTQAPVTSDNTNSARKYDNAQKSNVRIKMPDDERIENITIRYNGTEVWSGKHGEAAVFYIAKAGPVFIDFGTDGIMNLFFDIKPEHKYKCVADSVDGRSYALVDEADGVL